MKKDYKIKIVRRARCIADTSIIGTWNILEQTQEIINVTEYEHRYAHHATRLTENLIRVCAG